MAVEIAPEPRIVVVSKAGTPATSLILEHERAFLAIMQDESDRALLTILRYVERYGDVDGLRLPLSGIERAAFADLVLAGEAGWAWGHSEILTSLRSRYRIRVRKADFDPSDLFATEANLYGMPRSFSSQYMQRRELELAGVYEQARLRQTKVIVERAIREGHGIPGIQQKLGKQFPTFTEGRLRNIARTEANTLFSHGKYARLQSSPYVIGYEFFAVMDARTTDICASRHGHHYARGSAVDVPPLHFQAVAEGEICLTRRGEVPIENVRIGDDVLTHTRRWRAVTMAVGRAWEGTLHTIHTSGGELRLTPEHPVLTTRGWLHAEMISAGDDRIMGYKGAGHPTTMLGVMSNTRSSWTGSVFDLSVAHDESYCVEGHFVHNCRSELLPIFTDEKVSPKALPADAPPPITWNGKTFGRAPDITGFQEKLARQRKLPPLWVPRKDRKRIRPRPRPKPRKRVRPVSAPLRAKLLGAAAAVKRLQLAAIAAEKLSSKQRAALLLREEEER